ncbi:hypothetical protein HOP50_07g46620 [Chloropicon primus]|nr:hypothetical protein HOP50_07g46620 [Chloropicon primus]
MRGVTVGGKAPRVVEGRRQRRGVARDTRVKVSSAERASGVGSGSTAADRYVAMNRFRVQERKEGADAKFEKRWAERPSRLATMDGFRWFALFRRVNRDGSPLDEEAHADYNYTSMTLWEDKETFKVWREGDVFKEAHGGGNIKGILDMLISSAQTLKGKPKLLLANAYKTSSVSVSESDLPKMAGGWRELVADGVNLLEPECFMAANDFVVTSGQEEAFLEEANAKIIEKARTFPGFRFGTVLNADNNSSEEGDVYATATVWDDQASWEAFAGEDGAKAGVSKNVAAKDPFPRYFEGKLVLTTQKGA